ncbi:polyprenyl synthetase family protein [Nocardioides sp. TRM66260-LWL]|uniref:polyprenyl synthetase family protein n=1 Tax=Nocardioides sp. TRM66260-LWL TaxID=2874478 RepID=UPI001CC76190|nr:polyprenyl synthetase family protein [Nocardioides sp. TRM66260-LWL]MBZ5734573.1 polyprenyl synthetase family protein [Nocardioides sp. TRM66260-LWL]
MTADPVAAPPIAGLRVATEPRVGVDAALSAVETVLDRRLHDLAAQWRRLAESGLAADPILGVHDLPGLLADLVRAGGKRFRPLLCHWGYLAAGGEDPEGSAELGAALELLHVFGLAQDDVMDASTTRRGRPAVHVRAADAHRASGGLDDAARYGESIATLVGDLAHAEADALVAGLAAPVRAEWWLTSVELVRGQARDLAGAARGAGSDALARAWEVARAKSGAYTVERPLRLGALLGGGEPATLAALSTYGRALGEAFALRDDLLGVFGDPELTGKPAGDDLREGKATVLLALLEERLPAADLGPLTRVRSHHHQEDDVRVVTTQIEDTGVRAEVETLIGRAHATAVAALDDPAVAVAARAGLRGVADQVAWRDR